jgi:hypothetical protein
MWFQGRSVAGHNVGPAITGVTQGNTVAEAAPKPTLFTARNLMRYVVKFVRPFTITGEVVPTASAQVLPAFVEN